MEAEAEKIAVRARTAEVAGQREAELTESGAHGQRAGMGWPAEKTVTGDLSGIKGIWRFEDAAVVVGVVGSHAEPTAKMCFTYEVDAASAGEIGVEEIAPKEWASEGLRNRTATSGKA